MSKQDEASEELRALEDKLQTPGEHRLEEELRVCDPFKADRTMPVDKVRVERMVEELVEGFKVLKKYRLAATFFGSARSSLGSEFYDAATLLAAKLAKANFAVITGGGHGIMEAANKGAHEAKGQSVGLNIKLPHEQVANGYLTEMKTFNYFFTRKVMLTFASEVYIYFPGGFGTLDELFEILTLIQTHKIKRIPVILYGKDYWGPIVKVIEEDLLKKHKTIDPEDLELYTVVDSVEEAYHTILKQVKC